MHSTLVKTNEIDFINGHYLEEHVAPLELRLVVVSFAIDTAPLWGAINSLDSMCACTKPFLIPSRIIPIMQTNLM